MAEPNHAYLKPRDAKTLKQVCSLRRDNASRGGFWVLVDETSVTVCKQKSGEPGGPMVTMPRYVWEHFAHFYENPQRISKHNEVKNQ